MITVIDYGAGNIGSVLNMIRKVGGQSTVAKTPELLHGAEKILLPGVGSFDNAMSRLHQLGLVEPLIEHVNRGRPLFGICLGMQLLAERSDEGVLPGLSLIPGQVRRFNFTDGLAHLKIPHMGWNQVRPVRPHAMTTGLEQDARFYFVHSYHFDCADPADRLFVTDYGQEFTSGVQRGHVMGVQFHPEKSHRFGMQLLKNFMEL